MIGLQGDCIYGMKIYKDFFNVKENDLHWLVSIVLTRLASILSRILSTSYQSMIKYLISSLVVIWCTKIIVFTFVFSKSRDSITFLRVADVRWRNNVRYWRHSWRRWLRGYLLSIIRLVAFRQLFRTKTVKEFSLTKQH